MTKTDESLDREPLAEQEPEALPATSAEVEAMRATTVQIMRDRMEDAQLVASLIERMKVTSANQDQTIIAIEQLARLLAVHHQALVALGILPAVAPRVDPQAK